MLLFTFHHKFQILGHFSDYPYISFSMVGVQMFLPRIYRVHCTFWCMCTWIPSLECHSCKANLSVESLLNEIDQCWPGIFLEMNIRGLQAGQIAEKHSEFTWSFCNHMQKHETMSSSFDRSEIFFFLIILAWILRTCFGYFKILANEHHYVTIVFCFMGSKLKFFIWNSMTEIDFF